MLALISPAKKLDFDAPHNVTKTSQVALLDDTQLLVDKLKQMKPSEIQSLMKLSDKLGQLNYDRYQAFETPFTTDNARPAITAFRGDTYVGLDADTLSSDHLNYAQNHLGILSGLYGLLRPLDLMQAYRLEMGTKLPNNRGEDLYDFWGERITDECNKVIKNHKNKTIISLASNEYIKAIKTNALDGDFMTCHFKEIKNGAPKVIGLFAKRARGMMARFMIQHKIETPEGLKDFNMDGYAFDASLSDNNNYVFLREKK